MRPPLIVDPVAAPVVAVDDHLPPVPVALLTPDALRERFARPSPGWQPEVSGDGNAWSTTGRPPAPASVLVPLVVRDQGLQLLLTRRTDHLRAHAGQISFPGGRQEDDDADAVEAALREAEEEVGLERRHVEVIGVLPAYLTVTSFRVTPVVALVQPGFTLALDHHEVAEAFEVPLDFLMTPAHHRHHEVEVGGVKRRFLSMPWSPDVATRGAPTYFIWGATASMLRNLYRFLAA